MKNKICIAFLISLTSLSNTIHAQSLNYLWGKTTKGSFGQGTSIASDPSGNVLVTGEFNDGTLSFGNTKLNSQGGLDIFVAKYNASGNILWAKSAGGSNFDSGKGFVQMLTEMFW